MHELFASYREDYCITSFRIQIEISHAYTHLKVLVHKHTHTISQIYALHLKC
jgi:hypothetical protein